MGRRSYRNAEVYIGDDLAASNATVIYDSVAGTLTVKSGGEMNVHEGVTDPTGPVTNGRDRVRTWTLAGGTVLTALTRGCNCGAR